MFSCLQILEAFLWFVLITLLNVTLIILTLSVSRLLNLLLRLVFFFQAEDGIRVHCVTGVQTCALPILTGTNLASFDANGVYVELRRCRSCPAEAGCSPSDAPSRLSSRSIKITARFCWRQCCLRSRSEEHTSELQSHSDLVCRLLLEKKK